MIYSSNDKPQKWPKSDAHDPDSEVEYPVYWGLPIRENSKAYVQYNDAVLPPTANGCMYECVSGGITAASPPTMATVENEYTDDGDVKWKCLPLGSRLGHGDIVQTVTCTADAGVTIGATSITDGIITVAKVIAVPAGAISFTLTFIADILYADGRTEKRVKSLIIPVKDI